MLVVVVVELIHKILMDHLENLGGQVDAAVARLKSSVSSDEAEFSSAKEHLLKQVENLYEAVRSTNSPSPDVAPDLDKLFRSGNLINYAAQELVTSADSTRKGAANDIDLKSTRVTNGVKNILKNARVVLG